MASPVRAIGPERKPETPPSLCQGACRNLYQQGVPETGGRGHLQCVTGHQGPHSEGRGEADKERRAGVSDCRALCPSTVASHRRICQDRACFAAEGIRAKQRHPRDIWSFPATSLASAPKVGNTWPTQAGGERAERSLRACGKCITFIEKYIILNQS